MRWPSRTPAGTLTSRRLPPTWRTRSVPVMTSSRVTLVVGRRIRTRRGAVDAAAACAARPEARRGMAGPEVPADAAEERLEVGIGAARPRAPAGRRRGRRRAAGRATREERAEEVAEAGEVLGVAVELEADAAGRAAAGAGEARERVAPPPGSGTSALVGLPVRAELVVRLALLGVREDLVGLADLLEALLGAGVALVDVGMVLAGEPAKGLPDLGLAGRARNAERGVVVPILHPRAALVGQLRAALDRTVARRPCPRPPAAGRRAGTTAVVAGAGWVSRLARLEPVGEGALSACGLRRRAASRTSSIVSTSTSFMRLRISSGMSRRSFSFLRGRMTIFAPDRCAARILLLRPPIGSTRPRSVISPVIATSLRTGMPVSELTIAVAIVMPAEGPSLGMAPAGTWMCIVYFSKSSRSMPSCAACARIHDWRGTCRLAHDVAQLAGEEEVLLALHPGDLDRDDVAADLGDDEARRRADLVLGLQLAVLEAGRTEQVGELLARDDRLGLAALGDRPGDLAHDARRARARGCGRRPPSCSSGPARPSPRR